MRALAIVAVVLVVLAGCAAFGSSNGAGEVDDVDAAAPDASAGNADGGHGQGGGGDDATTTDDSAPEGAPGNALSDSGVPLNCNIRPATGTILFCNDFDQHDAGETPYQENPSGGTALSVVHYVSGPNALEAALSGIVLKDYASFGNASGGESWDISFDVWLEDAPTGVTFAQLNAGVSSVTLATVAAHVVKVDIFDAQSGQQNTLMKGVAPGWVHVDALLVPGSSSSSVTVTLNGSTMNAPFTGAPQLSLNLGIFAGGDMTTKVSFDDVLGTGP